MLNVLKNAFLDGNNKPKPVPFAIVLLVILLAVFIMFSGPAPGTAQSPGVLDVQQVMPKPSQRSEINFANEFPEAEYVQRGELNAELRKQLKDLLTDSNGQQSLENANLQNDLIRAIKEERKNDLDLIRGEMDYQNEELRKQIADLKKQIISPTGNNGNFNGTYSGNYPGTGTGTNTGNNPNLPANNYDPNSNTVTYNSYSSTDTNTSISGSKIVLDNFAPRNNPVIIGSNGKLSVGVTLGEGINAGTYIPGIIKTGCVSSAEPCPVLVYTTEDVIYRDKVVMPKGTSLLGVGIADFSTRKIFIRLYKIVLSKREIEVKAHLVDEKGQTGFCSKYIDKVMEKFLPTLLLQITAGALQAFKDISYFTTGGGILTKLFDDTPKNAAIDGLSQGAETWSNMILNDAKNQGAIIIVNPELKAKIFIDEKIPIDYFTRNY